MTTPPTTGGEPAQVRLVVDDLQIRLSGSGPDIVDEISFAVASGEIMGLVGESGSGKTTIALALLGHARRGVRITRGKVVLDGVDVMTLSGADLQAFRGSRASYVPQDPASALNPALRIGTQLAEILRAHRGAVADPKTRVAEVLREVNLDPTEELLRRYPHQLSGGQQQRVAIAMAFACRPSLIVLDEPTTGLDVTTQRHVLDTVRSLCRSYGVAGVYVSHDLAVVAGLADRVAVLYAGRMMEIGETLPIFRAPIHPYTRGLLAAIPSPDRAEVLLGIPGQPPRPASRPGGCPFWPRCPVALETCRSSFPVVAVAGRQVRCVRAAEIAREPSAVHTRHIPSPPPAGPAALVVNGLSARYGSAPVLHDVSFDVPAKQCVAIVGESGSGKTTLARCIVGLHSTWSGGLTFEGAPLGAGALTRSGEALRRIQYIFQNPYGSLNPRKTIGQILGQPLEHFLDVGRAERQARIRASLEEVSLGDDYVDRYPDQLSGGQRQRVAIARALIVEPTLLVCDEVTSALDVSVQAVIVELLRRLQSERELAILFITHNLSLVRTIAQTCVVLADGRIVEAGAVDDVLERPQAAYTVRLMDDVPKFPVGAARSS